MKRTKIPVPAHIMHLCEKKRILRVRVRARVSGGIRVCEPACVRCARHHRLIGTQFFPKVTGVQPKLSARPVTEWFILVSRDFVSVFLQTLLVAASTKNQKNT